MFLGFNALKSVVPGQNDHMITISTQEVPRIISPYRIVPGSHLNEPLIYLDKFGLFCLGFKPDQLLHGPPMTPYEVGNRPPYMSPGATNSQYNSQYPNYSCGGGGGGGNALQGICL